MFKQNVIAHAKLVRVTLEKNKNKYSTVIPKFFIEEPSFIFDFTENNKELLQIDLSDIKSFTDYIESKLKKGGWRMGAGGYGEDRILYKRSSLFTGSSEPRSVHFAVDLWLPARTPVFAPIAGKIHSFQDNRHFLDYGPTIILEHLLDNVRFYTLYGHLSRDSLKDIFAGQEIKQGSKIAEIGDNVENGQWPPHLHFQVITDMLGKKGDFPGVVRPSEKKDYLMICPNPNLMLQLPSLANE